nr:MAG TPA: hypothetical protein [Caudoviricetes sp.]
MESLITYYCPLERCRFVNKQKGRCTLGIVDKYGRLCCPNMEEYNKAQRARKINKILEGKDVY